jgi:hypothetical protein
MFEILNDNNHYFEIECQRTNWQAPDGRSIIEKDLKVNGEVWRVHKYDDDLFPSSPHAHCLSGPGPLPGCKLHLGNRKLYKDKKFIGRLLDKKEFQKLIELLRPKFPEITLPLP